MQPAGLRSIRWQLPLSYALIALVSAVALGVLLIGLLRQYYWQQEYDILDSMSMVLARQMGYRLDTPLESTVLETLPSFSFPPDYRIEFFSPEGDTVFDTGILNTLTVEFSDSGVANLQPIMLPQYDMSVGDFALHDADSDLSYIISSSGWGSTGITSAGAFSMQAVIPPTLVPLSIVQPQADGTGHDFTTLSTTTILPTLAPITTAQPQADGITTRPEITMFPTVVPSITLAERWPIDAQDRVFSNISVAAPSNGIVWRVARDGLGAVAFAAADEVRHWETPVNTLRNRSSAAVTRMIVSPVGQVMGYVRLSNPPMIGAPLIDSVTSGAIIAGAGATIIAAVLGWWVSLRLTRPLLELNNATARMAQGDLAVRVAASRGDELGILADSFNGMANKVEATVAALRRFAADAAHELHTPLTALRTNLELTQERPDDARLTQAVSQISRLEALADDLLDLSRLEVAEPPRQESIDISALAREVSEVYASRAEQQNIDFTLHLAAALPTIHANAPLLRRAVSNLLDNAVKFTPAGGDVSLNVYPDAGRLALAVSDSGIGVPPADLPVLFSRFHRGSNTADYPGSGLGLAIVKAIADVHQGSVYAENTPSGARFILYLPTTAA